MPQPSQKLAKMVFAIAIISGLAAYGSIDKSYASVPPPGGDPIQSIYVNNKTGKDSNDGSQEKPFATVQRGNKALNVSGAPYVKLYIEATGIPYELGSDDIWNKRINVEFISRNGRAKLIGQNKYDGSGSRLNKVTFQETGGVIFKGFYLVDFAIEARSSNNITIQDNIVDIVDVRKIRGPLVNIFEDPNNYSDISSSDIKLYDNTVIVADQKEVDNFVGINISQTLGAKVNSNILQGNLVTGINLFDVTGIEMANNVIKNSTEKFPVLYAFDQVNQSKTFSIWPY